MLFEGYLESVINKFCGRWLENFNRNNLSINLAQGTIVLKDIVLNTIEIKELCFPIDPRLVYIGRLHVNIPISLSRPIIVEVNDVSILIRAIDRDGTFFDPKLALQAHIHILQEILEKQYMAISNSFQGPLLQQFLKSSVAKTVIPIIQNIEVVFKNIHIRVEDTTLGTNTGSPLSSGSPPMPVAIGCIIKSIVLMPWSKKDKAGLEFLNGEEKVSNLDVKNQNKTREGKEYNKKTEIRSKTQEKVATIQKTETGTDNGIMTGIVKDENQENINIVNGDSTFPNLQRRRRSSFSSMNEDLSIAELRQRRNSFGSQKNDKEQEVFSPTLHPRSKEQEDSFIVNLPHIQIPSILAHKEDEKETEEIKNKDKFDLDVSTEESDEIMFTKTPTYRHHRRGSNSAYVDYNPPILDSGSTPNFSVDGVQPHNNKSQNTTSVTHNLVPPMSSVSSLSSYTEDSFSKIRDKIGSTLPSVPGYTYNASYWGYIPPHIKEEASTKAPTTFLDKVMKITDCGCYDDYGKIVSLEGEREIIQTMENMCQTKINEKVKEAKVFGNEENKKDKSQIIIGEGEDSDKTLKGGKEENWSWIIAPCGLEAHVMMHLVTNVIDVQIHIDELNLHFTNTHLQLLLSWAEILLGHITSLQRNTISPTATLEGNQVNDEAKKSPLTCIKTINEHLEARKGIEDHGEPSLMNQSPKSNKYHNNNNNCNNMENKNKNIKMEKNRKLTDDAENDMNDTELDSSMIYQEQILNEHLKRKYKDNYQQDLKSDHSVHYLPSALTLLLTEIPQPTLAKRRWHYAYSQIVKDIRLLKPSVYSFKDSWRDAARYMTIRTLLMPYLSNVKFIDQTGGQHGRLYENLKDFDTVLEQIVSRRKLVSSFPIQFEEENNLNSDESSRNGENSNNNFDNEYEIYFQSKRERQMLAANWSSYPLPHEIPLCLLAHMRHIVSLLTRANIAATITSLDDPNLPIFSPQEIHALYALQMELDGTLPIVSLTYLRLEIDLRLQEFNALKPFLGDVPRTYFHPSKYQGLCLPIEHLLQIKSLRNSQLNTIYINTIMGNNLDQEFFASFVRKINPDLTNSGNITCLDSQEKGDSIPKILKSNQIRGNIRDGGGYLLLGIIKVENIKPVNKPVIGGSRQADIYARTTFVSTTETSSSYKAFKSASSDFQLLEGHNKGQHDNQGSGAKNNVAPNNLSSSPERIGGNDSLARKRQDGSLLENETDAKTEIKIPHKAISKKKYVDTGYGRFIMLKKEEGEGDGEALGNICRLEQMLRFQVPESFVANPEQSEESKALIKIRVYERYIADFLIGCVYLSRQDLLSAPGELQKFKRSLRANGDRVETLNRDTLQKVNLHDSDSNSNTTLSSATESLESFFSFNSKQSKSAAIDEKDLPHGNTKISSTTENRNQSDLKGKYKISNSTGLSEKETISSQVENPIRGDKEKSGLDIDLPSLHFLSLFVPPGEDLSSYENYMRREMTMLQHTMDIKEGLTTELSNMMMTPIPNPNLDPNAIVDGTGEKKIALGQDDRSLKFQSANTQNTKRQGKKLAFSSLKENQHHTVEDKSSSESRTQVASSEFSSKDKALADKSQRVLIGDRIILHDADIPIVTINISLPFFSFSLGLVEYTKNKIKKNEKEQSSSSTMTISKRRACAYLPIKTMLIHLSIDEGALLLKLTPALENLEKLVALEAEVSFNELIMYDFQRQRQFGNAMHIPERRSNQSQWKEEKEREEDDDDTNRSATCTETDTVGKRNKYKEKNDKRGSYFEEYYSRRLEEMLLDDNHHRHRSAHEGNQYMIQDIEDLKMAPILHIGSVQVEVEVRTSLSISLMKKPKLLSWSVIIQVGAYRLLLKPKALFNPEIENISTKLLWRSSDFFHLNKKKILEVTTGLRYHPDVVDCISWEEKKCYLPLLYLTMFTLFRCVSFEYAHLPRRSIEGGKESVFSETNLRDGKKEKRNSQFDSVSSQIDIYGQRKTLFNLAESLNENYMDVPEDENKKKNETNKMKGKIVLPLGEESKGRDLKKNNEEVNASSSLKEEDLGDKTECKENDRERDKEQKNSIPIGEEARDKEQKNSIPIGEEAGSVPTPVWNRRGSSLSKMFHISKIASTKNGFSQEKEKGFNANDPSSSHTGENHENFIDGQTSDIKPKKDVEASSREMEIRRLTDQIQVLKDERDFWKSLAENYKLQMNEGLLHSASELSPNKRKVQHEQNEDSSLRHESGVKDKVFNIIGDGVNVLSAYSVASLSPTQLKESNEKDEDKDQTTEKDANKLEDRENGGWLW